MPEIYAHTGGIAGNYTKVKKIYTYVDGLHSRLSKVYCHDGTAYRLVHDHWTRLGTLSNIRHSLIHGASGSHVLYVMTQSGVYYWNGSSWASYTNGFRGWNETLTVGVVARSDKRFAITSAGTLYSLQFNSGYLLTYLRYWSGSTWSDVDLSSNFGTSNYEIGSVVTNGSSVYVVGSASGSGVLKILWYNGSTWSEIFSISRTILTTNWYLYITVANGYLYMIHKPTMSSGNFETSYWNGSSWVVIGSLQVLAVGNPSLVTADDSIYTVGGTSILMHNGSAWVTKVTSTSNMTAIAPNRFYADLNDLYIAVDYTTSEMDIYGLKEGSTTFTTREGPRKGSWLVETAVINSIQQVIYAIGVNGVYMANM